MNKTDIRNNIKSKREALANNEVIELSNKIIKKTISLLEKYSIDTYFIYNSFKNEVNTQNLIQYLLKNNKNVYLPKVINDDMFAVKYDIVTKLETGSFGILQPAGDPITIDNFICILPLIAVDKHGNRIGFGKGYYDKFLKNKTCIKIGLCYDFQIIDELIDIREEDVPLDIIISEKQIIEIKKTR